MHELKQVGMRLLILGVILGMGAIAFAQVGVTTSAVVGVDIAPSIEMKIGANPQAKAQMVMDHATNVRADAHIGEADAQLTGVDAPTASLLVKLGISPSQFNAMVSSAERATILARILSARAAVIARIEANAEARADLAERLEERADIIKLTGLDQAIARVEYAHALALRAGRTELAAQLELVLQRLRLNKANQQEPSDEDMEEVNRRVWQLHSERLLVHADASISLAQRIDTQLEAMIAKMDILSVRLEANGRSSTHIAVLLQRIKGYESSFDASIDAAIAAQAAFESEMSVANARTLHAALVEMNSLARTSGKVALIYVRLHNYLSHRATASDNVAADIAAEGNVDASAVAQAEVDAVMASSLYG